MWATYFLWLSWFTLIFVVVDIVNQSPSDAVGDLVFAVVYRLAYDVLRQRATNSKRKS